MMADLRRIRQSFVRVWPIIVLLGLMPILVINAGSRVSIFWFYQGIGIEWHDFNLSA
jgi:hypothetical protein